ncbi:MAG TPA: hypothetical protein VF737_16270, partial [Gemmatimonadaceae bacterium]
MAMVLTPLGDWCPDGTEQAATAAIEAFCDDLDEQAHAPLTYIRRAEHDHAGRFAFDVVFDGRSVSVLMPGLPLERVRYTGAAGQRISRFPRLYVDGG